MAAHHRAIFTDKLYNVALRFSAITVTIDASVLYHLRCDEGRVLPAARPRS